MQKTGYTIEHLFLVIQKTPLHLIFLAPCLSWALDTGILSVNNRFSEDLASAEPALTAALDNMQTSYAAADPASNISCVEIDYSNSQTPIASIVYGFVQNTSSSDPGCYYNKFQTVGNDNFGMFVLEVTFKTQAQTSSLSSTLAGKSLLFLPYGKDNSSLVPQFITTSNANSTNRILDFACVNKKARCSNGSQNQHSSAGCSSSSKQTVNQGTRAGVIHSQANSINLFHQAPESAFYSCSQANASTDMLCEMSATSCP